MKILFGLVVILFCYLLMAETLFVNEANERNSFRKKRRGNCDAALCRLNCKFQHYSFYGVCTRGACECV
ncbi:unnamed protein product [Tenebrio molitor]|nr:unnamed protein product [Tenebrio molitor]